MEAFSWLANRQQQFHSQRKCFGPDTSKRLPGRTIKVLVLGDEGVGKTSLVKSLLRQDLATGKNHTVYDVYEKEFKEAHGTIRVEFTVITGKFAFPAMERLAIKRSDVFVLVYSLEKRKTLKEIERLRKVLIETKNQHSTEIPIIVVGNKLDLLPSSPSFDNNTGNTIEEWCFSHIHTSVRNDINLSTLEAALIQECTLNAIVTKKSARRTNSGSIKYRY